VRPRRSEPPEPDAFTDDEFRVWRGFLRTHRTVSDELNRRLEQAHDLTLLRYGVLITLVTDPDRRLRMTDLAERVLTSPSGMTRAVGRLAAEGLVERDRDPDDGRSFIVGLTPLGLTRLREAQVTHHACVRELLFHGLTDDDLQRLGAIYDRTTSA
jgi:DNA-binding MarR family transcriptional regulator